MMIHILNTVTPDLRIDIFMLTGKLQGIDHEPHAKEPCKNKDGNMQQLQEMVVAAGNLENYHDGRKRQGDGGRENNPA